MADQLPGVLLHFLHFTKFLVFLLRTQFLLHYILIILHSPLQLSVFLCDSWPYSAKPGENWHPNVLKEGLIVMLS